MNKSAGQVCALATSPPQHVHLRLFGLQRASDSNIRKGTFPFSTGLTVAQLWEELQQTSQPGSPMATLPRDKVLALVNGLPVQRLDEWATLLKAGDTVTFMAKAFGG